MPTAPFSLQPVLTYQENMVDLLERQLAQLLAERTSLQEVLRTLRLQLTETHTLLQREQRGRLRLEAIQQHRLFLEWLRERIETEQRTLEALEARIAAKRDELVAMMQDKKMLERLKEKAEERFAAHLESQEADLSDEIALAQFVRANKWEPGYAIPTMPAPVA